MFYAYLVIDKIPFRKIVGKGPTEAHLMMMLEAEDIKYDFIEKDA